MKVLHCQDNLTKINFNVLFLQFHFLLCAQVKKQLATWVVIEKKVKIVLRLEWTMKVNSVIVGRKQGEDFLLLDDSLPCFKVVHSLFSQSFHGKQIPGDLISYKVHFTNYAFSQTFEKLKIQDTDFVDIFFNRVQSFEL